MSKINLLEGMSNADLSVGRGALVRVGVFWYPARLLKRHIDHNGNRFWRVSIWRHAECLVPPYTTKDQVPEGDIRDELWQDINARRQIRVRHGVRAMMHPDPDICLL